MNEYKELFKTLALSAIESSEMATDATGKITLVGGEVVEFEMQFIITKCTAYGETWNRED